MRTQGGMEIRFKKAAAVVFGLLLALAVMVLLEAAEGTPGPATAPCVAPSPPKW